MACKLSQEDFRQRSRMSLFIDYITSACLDMEGGSKERCATTRTVSAVYAVVAKCGRSMMQLEVDTH